MKYSERASLTTNPTAKKLFTIMEEKHTNLSVAADVTTKKELLELAKKVGPQICVLKTHIDIIEDFDQDLIIQLQRLAEQHTFLIFEDRKFADIGNTVLHQYEGGVYHIADWADITNAHIIPGPGIIEGLREIGVRKGRGLLLLAQMSSHGSYAQGDYTQENVRLAQEYNDFVIGFIAQEKISDNPAFIHMTPGVQIEAKGDTLGQQYNSPEYVIQEKGTDVIIVGRGIYQAQDPAKAAKEYKTRGWNAYKKARG